MTDTVTTTTTDPIADSGAADPAAAVVAPVDGGAAATDAAPDDILGVPEKPEGEVVATEAPAVPEAYDLIPPEGFEALDPELMAAATPVFKEMGLTNDQANTLMPLVPAVMQRATDALQTQMIEQQAAIKSGWAKDAMADPEIGGPKWGETVQSSARGLDALGFGESHPFRVLLSETGLGNHPDMIRTFAQLGRLAGEASFVAGSATDNTSGDALSVMYPNNKRNK